MSDLRGRSIRTLAWLGDVEFEREVRYRLARRGDFPTDRLDAMKTRVVRAEAQAELLARIEPALSEAEQDVVRRGRNAQPPRGGRGGRRCTREYRSATALEVLVASWCQEGDQGRARMHAVLTQPLESAIDDALAADARRPRRG